MYVPVVCWSTTFSVVTKVSPGIMIVLPPIVYESPISYIVSAGCCMTVTLSAGKSPATLYAISITISWPPLPLVVASNAWPNLALYFDSAK